MCEEIDNSRGKATQEPDAKNHDAKRRSVFVDRFRISQRRLATCARFSRGLLCCLPDSWRPPSPITVSNGRGRFRLLNRPDPLSRASSARVAAGSGKRKNFFLLPRASCVILLTRSEQRVIFFSRDVPCWLVPSVLMMIIIRAPTQCGDLILSPAAVPFPARSPHFLARLGGSPA